MIFRNLLPISLFTALLSSASAATISDDFSSGNDDRWTRLSILEDIGSGATYSFPQGSYRISAPASSEPETYGPARAGSLLAGAEFSDFTVSVDLLDLSLNLVDTDLGLLTRVHNIGLGSTNGYGFTYDMGGLISLFRITGEQDNLLAEAPLLLSSAGSYRMELTATGTHFLASVVALANPGVILASLSATDSAYATGAVGVIVYDDSISSDQAALGTFDNFLVTVPEPGAALLLGIGALGMGMGRRKRA